jgi:hypothetical protein
MGIILLIVLTIVVGELLFIYILTFLCDIIIVINAKRYS